MSGPSGVERPIQPDSEIYEPGVREGAVYRHLSMADKKDAVSCAQIGEDSNRFSEPGFGLRVDGGFLQDGEADFMGKFSEILDRDHPDVGGVVPLIGQLPADRRIA